MGQRYLERRWEILDTTKRVRNQIPLTLGGMILAVVAFILSSDKFPASYQQKQFAVFGLLGLMCVCLALIAAIHVQYRFACDEVGKTYERLEFDADLAKNNEWGGLIWGITYLMIFVLGILGAILIYMVEVKSDTL